ELDYTIQCRLPGERRYRGLLGLPLCMALIASYIQRDIPAHHVYIGEVDLLRKIREVPEQILVDLVEGLQNGTVRTPIRVFCPPASADVLRDGLQGATIVGCERLDDAVFKTWPELAPQKIK